MLVDRVRTVEATKSRVETSGILLDGVEVSLAGKVVALFVLVTR